MALMLEVNFDRGTLLVEAMDSSLLTLFPYLKWDERVKKYRSPAYCYRNFILSLRKEKIPYLDKAKNFSPVTLSLKKQIIPRDHQAKALKSWLEKGSQGVVVLPTGAGKTILAVMAIAQTNRPTLVHVPTLDLMHQWFHVLSQYFSEPIGLLGGGERDIRTITVATYDSALIYVDQRGQDFGLLVFDECHHLPGNQLQYTALSSLAPFRLGLTATPDSDGGRAKVLSQLCGDICFEVQIQELSGNTLAPYEVKTKAVELTQEEQQEYEECRQKYLAFLKAKGISFAQGGSWQQFLRVAHRSEEGKQAFQAYLRQKKIAQSSKNKIQVVWEILRQHLNDPILIFTQDNETAYHLGRMFFLPVLTHHTKVKERESFLTCFRNGTYRILVTSKVLNEGVDVPEASVAIVFSGSGAVREHVQRLGRILRSKPGKKAILYELISANTGEYFVNQRRREHHAYKKRTSVL